MNQPEIWNTAFDIHFALDNAMGRGYRLGINTYYTWGANEELLLSRHNRLDGRSTDLRSCSGPSKQSFG